MLVTDGGAADFDITMFTLQQHVPAAEKCSIQCGSKWEIRIQS